MVLFLRYSIVCVFVITSVTAFTQSLSGIVQDDDGFPMPGVNVVNLSGMNHAHTAADGKFQLDQVSVGDSLEFSYIGFDNKLYVIKSLNEIVNIEMQIDVITLDEVIISPDLNALNVVSNIDIQLNPVSSSQEVLQAVPGLFIGQHAGGGKAEQIFLRGFDIDHGTDVNITVDGLPVNMVSHAHGQGYADLHFLIPELIDKIDFGKGPYYADQGNFNTAGYVDFKTKDRFKNSLVKVEVGSFNTQRILGVLNILETDNHDFYIAKEYIKSDGPFESPQGFRRSNIAGKYTGKLSADNTVSVSASHFTSTWNASGQIPVRAVNDGSIGRFGAIDDTEGGMTSRTNLLINNKRFIDKDASINTSVFFTNYNFELFSNFTFFLNDPINGDQILQKEERNIVGINSVYTRNVDKDNLDIVYQAGVSLRNDRSRDNELARTKNRSEVLSQIQFGNITETNISAFTNASFTSGKWTIHPALRFDVFDFQYEDALSGAFSSQSANASVVSPKLNVFYNYDSDLQFFVKSGFGFHSNDARVVVAQNGKEILPRAFGVDVGALWKPTPNLFVSAAYWYLFLEQEFVYVGDEGVVEPSGRTKRRGTELNVSYQPTSWIYANLDANYTIARAIDEPEGVDFIPLAPDLTIAAGVNVVLPSGMYGGVDLRLLDDRPANEDNSIVAEGYQVVDFNLGYKWKRMNYALEIQNLFDTEWNETQFATRSRLLGESSPVEEIHFTPGAPFAIKGTFSYSF